MSVTTDVPQSADSTVLPDDATCRFSKWSGTPRGFMDRLAYDPDRESGRRRGEGDHYLFGLIDKECGDETAMASLGESELQRLVDVVEGRLSKWRLSGDDSQPILARLDAHFAEPQARWRAWRERRAEEIVRHERAVTERRLQEVRGYIGLHTEVISSEKELLRNLKAEAAALAAKLEAESA